MKLLERLRLQEQIKNITLTGGTPTGKPDPKLEKELKETKNQLNSILDKWKWEGEYPKSANEFINKFDGWINYQIEKQEELEEFLKEYSAGNLEKVKETWNNTEKDYLKKIEELKKSKGGSEEVEDLITERDEAIREKKTLEQSNLALNNRLTLKQQEVSNKDKSIEKLKKEKEELDKNLNKKITEKNGLITTLNHEIKQHKEKNKELDQQNAKLVEKLLELDPPKHIDL